MQAKDQQITELRAAIQQRDNSLQKFIKLNGSLVQNPKEEPYSKVIMQNYERAQVLQEEKIGLSEKAAALVNVPQGFTWPFAHRLVVGPLRQATGHQAARPSERWLHPIRPVHAVAAPRLAWQHGGSVVAHEHWRKHAAASSLRQSGRRCPESRASCSDCAPHQCDQCGSECKVKSILTEHANASAIEPATPD
jgi:hypothetical protein